MEIKMQETELQADVKKGWSAWSLEQHIVRYHFCGFVFSRSWSLRAAKSSVYAQLKIIFYAQGKSLAQILSILCVFNIMLKLTTFEVYITLRHWYFVFITKKKNRLGSIFKLKRNSPADKFG